VLQKVCNGTVRGSTTRLLALGEEYFLIGHRGASAAWAASSRLPARRERWSFVRDVGEAYCRRYAPLGSAAARLRTPTRTARSSSVARPVREFNLIYDPARFGLRTGGNVEAIFMSLPPLVAW